MQPERNQKTPAPAVFRIVKRSGDAILLIVNPEPSQIPPAEPYAPPSTAAPVPGDVNQDERQFAMFTHLSALLMAVGIPNFVGPLVLWLIKKDTMPFVDHQGKEALNFQLSFLIYGFIASISLFVLIGIVLLPLVGVVWLIFTIIAAIKANEGTPYRYPMTIRFIK